MCGWSGAWGSEPIVESNVSVERRATIISVESICACIGACMEGVSCVIERCVE